MIPDHREQFQITVNITAVLLAFISAVSNPDMHSVLTAVQLLWVNLIMDTFAALALATDPPTEKILDRPPQPKSTPLITTNMWKMIIGQAIFQLTATLILYFAGASIFGFDPNNSEQRLELNTMIFNTFVWMQIFNEFNNRRLDNKFNIFEGIHRNYFFIFINCIMVGAQIAIIFVGGTAFSIKQGGISGTQWGICIVIAFISLPWAVLIRLFPDAWFAKIANVVGGPFLFIYRYIAKFFTSIGRLFKRNKKTADNGEPLDETNKNRRDRRHSENMDGGVVGGSGGAAPALVVSSPAAPQIQVEDVEAGVQPPSRV
jgi:P-type Ca2+ transporter type 2C